VARPLRGDEILACVHRVALSRGAQGDLVTVPDGAEMIRRRRLADEHRRATIAELVRLHPDAAQPSTPEETAAAIADGSALILRPRLAVDRVGARSTTIQALARVGRRDATFTYAPVLVKNHEVVETAATRRTLEGSLDVLAPAAAEYLDGVGVRPSATVTRSGLALAHALRVLGAFGVADPHGRAALVDRQRRVWWLDLAGDDYPRFNLATYDTRYAERRTVLAAHDRWRAGQSPYPTSPYWHRDCPECPYRDHCEEELEASDDVSLTRFTTFDQQLALREHGVTTRASLAALDPRRVRAARAAVPIAQAELDREEYLARTIDTLDQLVYRARAHVTGTFLRIRSAEETGCPTADVEVDVDMESYDDVTYLWGAHVTVREGWTGVSAGYHSFAQWDDLSARGEAELFARFWQWFSVLRDACEREGRSFAAYCFWAQAEDGAMNRAVETPVPDGPTPEDLSTFRATRPAQWIDLHELCKRQVQTEGPLGLKLIAASTGFAWRDENPSGEASMLWYEVAVGGGPDAAASRQRILDYNEDDCRATRALREWLNGPARTLAHRDDAV